MLEFSGPIEAQAHDVLVDVGAGDLIVTRNGRVVLRMHLPAAKWAQLQAGAREVYERSVVKDWSTR